MRAAIGARNLCPGHSAAGIFVQLNIFQVYGVSKARPAASGLKLRIAAKEQVTAGNAVVRPIVVVVNVLSRKSRLGTLLPGYFILLRSQFIFPVLLWHVPHVNIIHIVTVLI